MKKIFKYNNNPKQTSKLQEIIQVQQHPQNTGFSSSSNFTRYFYSSQKNPSGIKYVKLADKPLTFSQVSNVNQTNPKNQLKYSIQQEKVKTQPFKKQSNNAFSRSLDYQNQQKFINQSHQPSNQFQQSQQSQPKVQFNESQNQMQEEVQNYQQSQRQQQPIQNGYLQQEFNNEAYSTGLIEENNQTMQNTILNNTLADSQNMNDPNKQHLQVKLYKVMKENESYLNNLADIYRLCTCGQCKPDGNQKNLFKCCRFGNTNYQQNYYPRQNIPHINIDQKYSTTKGFSTQKQLEYLSTSQSDYKVPSYIDRRRVIINKPSNFLEHDNNKYQTTTYQTSYLPYQHTPLKIRPQTSNQVHIQFEGKTNYQENHNKTYKKDPTLEQLIQKIRNTKFRSPITTNKYPFLGYTTTSSAFQPFKTQPNQRNNKSLNSKTTPGNNIGIFQSTAAKDFVNKQLNFCPARQILQQRQFDKKSQSINTLPNFQNAHINGATNNDGFNNNMD